MNYFSRIKPVLNKLSELNVYDSLYVVRAYMQACMDGNTNKKYIPNVHNSWANSVEVWFADFMIANIIKYCNDLPCSKSLRDVNSRCYICTPIAELHREVSHKLIDQEPFVWLNSYIFNQYKILAKDNELIALYRYYCLYKTQKIRRYAENKMNLPLDTYFKMVFFVYATFAEKERFYVEEGYLTPKKKEFNEKNKVALEYLLSQISRPLHELKILCKDFCCYDEEKIFGFFNDAPHVRFPLIKDKGVFYCTIPSYILTALLDGLYYRIDIPNSGDSDVNKEFSENMENYLRIIFEHFLEGSQVKYQQEITYNVGKRRTQRTSDWILWDETDICFMDCKTKRISVKGKQSVTVDDGTINRVATDKPFTKAKKKDIEEAIPEGLTKDLIHLGIGLGKVFVSYDDYQAGNVTGFPYMKGKKFHAVIVTLEQSFSNTPGYKERIIKVAQSYRDAKSAYSKPIDGKTVKILYVKDLEECACIIAKEGLGFYLEHHMDRKSIAQKYVKDRFLMSKCEEELINPFLEEIKEYF